VVLVLVGNDDGVEGLRIFAGQPHAAMEFAATKACVNQDAGSPT